jgi:pimeloyl-ACP methyl ester carboxylesterase
MRDEKHQSMLEGLAKLHANGGTIALWPLVKALLAKDDTVMREFWHAKLSEMNPRWVTGTAESMADEPDRSDELVAAGISSLVVFGKRDRRVWTHDAYAEMASRLRAGHVIIPKASHSPNMEQPGILAEALLEFWTAEDAYEGEPATVAG